MDFDEVRRPRITVKVGSAFDIDSQDRWKFVEKTAMDREVALVRIEVAEAETLDGEFEFVLVAGSKQQFTGPLFRIHIAAEEAAKVTLETVGQLIERNFSTELGSCHKDKKVILSPLPGSGEGRFSEAINEELKGFGGGSASLPHFSKALELVLTWKTTEVENSLPE